MESVAAMGAASTISSMHLTCLTSPRPLIRKQPKVSWSLVLSPACLLQLRVRNLSRPGRKGDFLSGVKVVSQARSEDVGSIGAAGIGAIAGGLVANPVVAWSLYTLKTTGCGLPPGPGGSIGAIEGVSYLVIVGVIGWSLFTKVKTGSGLPQGPFGLLGAVEGFSYLTLIAILVVFGLQALDYGFIPGPLPGKQCFG